MTRRAIPPVATTITAEESAALARVHRGTGTAEDAAIVEAARMRLKPLKIVHPSDSGTQPKRQKRQETPGASALRKSGTR
jgi:hypothetical protein